MTVPVTECTHCPALVKTRKCIVNGSGPPDAKIAFVGEGPGQVEDEKRRPFVGKAGRVLKVIQWAAGIDQRKVFYANATRCWGKRNPTPREVDACHEYLIEELRELNPTVIVSLGGPSLRSLYRPNVNVSDVMGFTLYHSELPGIPIIPTYHPSYIMRGHWGEAGLVLAHFRKAKRIADAGGTEEKLGSYMGITTLEELHALRDYLLGPDVEFISLDTETTGLSWMEAELLCISFSGEPGVGYSVPLLHRGEPFEPEQGRRRKKEVDYHIEPFWSEKEFPTVLAILDDILGSDKPKAGQNIEFDIRMLERRPDEPACRAKTAFGFLVNNVEYDTRVLSSLLFESIPHNLTVLNAYWTDIPYYEQEIAAFKKRMWHLPDETLWEYGAADVDVVSTLVPSLVSAVEEERTDWLYHNISLPLLHCANRLKERGVYIDIDYFDRLCAYYKDMLAQEKGELDGVVGHHVEHPTHYQHLQRLLFEEMELPLTRWAIDSAIKGAKRCKSCAKDSPCSVEHAATGADALEELYQRTQHPVLPYLIRLKSTEKFYSTYLEGGQSGGFRTHILEDGRIHGQWNAGRAETGRFTCEDPNLMNSPKEVKIHAPEYGLDSEDAIRSMFGAPPGFVVGNADWCLAIGTRVLTADLVWKAIEDIRSGDELVALDEHRSTNRPRKMRVGKVLCTAKRQAEVYRLRFESGEEILATAEHPWLGARQRNQSGMRTFEWWQTQSLRPGMRVMRGPTPWPSDNPELSFLGGFLEGEGSLDLSGKAPILSFSQKPGRALENVLTILRKQGFNPRGPYDKSRQAFGKADSYYITSAFEIMRLLGAGRPLRLLDKAKGGRKIYEGHQPRPYRWGGPRGLGYGIIASIESVGRQDVISLQTDCHTFLAEGFWSHNCQLEVWVLAYETGDPTLLDLLMSGKDVHVYVARKLCQLGVSRLFPHGAWESELSDDIWKSRHSGLRDKAKTFTFGLSYLLTEQGAADRLGCSLEEAHDLFVAFLTQVFPTLPDYFARIQQEILSTYGVRNRFNRRRHFPEVPILGALHYLTDLQSVIRQGVNYPIQSGGHDLHSLAHIHTEAYLAEEGILPVLEIHDSLMFEMPEGRAEALARQVKEEWESIARNLELPNGEQLGWQIPVDVRWGPSFGDPRYVLTAAGEIETIGKGA